jgi:signal transduction histidine kinase
MKKTSLKITIILAIDAVLLALCVINIIGVTRKSDIPDYDKQNLVFNKDFNGIKKGDVLTKLNESEISDSQVLEFFCDNLPVGTTVTLEIERNGKPIATKVALVHYYDVFYIIVLIFVGFMFILPAIYVLFKKPEETFSYVFHWLMLSVALMIVLTWGNMSGFNFEIIFFIRSVYEISILATPIILVHFSFLFPRKKWRNLQKLTMPLYIFLGAASVCMIALTNLAIVQKTSNAIYLYVSIHYYITKIFFAPALIFVLLNFLHSYKRYKEEYIRQKLLWIFVGFCFGPSIYVMLWIVPQLIIHKPLISESIMILTSVVSPVTFLLSIVKYRLFDINLIISRSTVYATAIILLLILYGGIFYLGTTIFPEKLSNMPSVVGAIIIALLFQPTKKFIQTIIDKNLFKVNYNINRVRMNFNSGIKDCNSFEQIANLVRNTTNEIISADSFGFLYFDPLTNNLEILENNNIKFNNENLILLNKEVVDNKAILPISLKDSIEEGNDFLYRESLLNSLNASLIVFYVSEDRKFFNALLIGRKKDFYMYTSEDIAILTTIVSESGKAIHRLILEREIFMQQEEKRRLEELNQLKSYFVSSVSHELKTPLTSIKLFAELMINKPEIQESKKAEYLEIIQGECDRLNRLISNVLDFAKIERGTKEYKFEPINLKILLDLVLKTISYQLKIQNFKLEIECEEIDYSYYGDPDAITEVYLNLLSNAIKYSVNKKEILIKLWATVNNFCISFSDKGTGISGYDKEKIFAPFYRSKDANSSGTGGTGIGLSLVKHIITAHKGKVEVESVVGDGSTFTLYFPKGVSYEKNINR